MGNYCLVCVFSLIALKHCRDFNVENLILIHEGSTVDDKFEYEKAKNIKQTELVADLRQAILAIIKHYRNLGGYEDMVSHLIHLGSLPSQVVIIYSV